MTPDPTKPKRQPLPRLWMQIADTLRLARPFRLAVLGTSTEILGVIQQMDFYPVEKSAFYQVSVNSDQFQIAIMDGYTRPSALTYIEGEVHEEEYMIISTMRGKIYPNDDLFVVLTPLVVILLGLIAGIGDMNRFCCVLLCLIPPLGIISILAWYNLETRTNKFLQLFTQHLQTAVAEQARLE